LQHAVGSDRPQQLLLGTAAGFSPRHRPAVSQERAHRLRGWVSPPIRHPRSTAAQTAPAAPLSHPTARGQYPPDFTRGPADT